MTSFDLKSITNAPFEQSSISALEGHAKSQASSGQYDFDANKSLMKAYACVGSDNGDMMATLLALSMMRLPSPHFLQLSYLVPGKMSSSNDKIAVLIKCADLLEKAKFPTFWSEIRCDTTAAVLKDIKGFEDSVRGFVLTVVSKTFKNIEKSTLLGMLGLSEDGTADADSSYVPFGST